MGKASSTKKVARAASTGGGRTTGVRRPYGWYTVLGAVVALGVFLVAFSRHEQQAAAAIHPRGSDHWHAAYVIDICGTNQPNLPQNPNLSSTTAPPGIHTHGDGLIHIEPYFSQASADAGNHATVARFAADYPGFKLTSTELQYPGQKLYKNGDKCGTKAAQVRIRVWAKATASTSITYTNPSDVHLKNGQLITIAFLPLTDDIPKPPQANINKLSNPNAAEPGNTATTLPVSPATTTARPPTTVAGTPTTAAATATTAAGTAGTATTSPGGSATTAKPGSTSPTSAP